MKARSITTADPVARIKALQQRTASASSEQARAAAKAEYDASREQWRQCNREQYPDVYGIVDAAANMGATVTQLDGVGRDHDDRVTCRKCQFVGRLSRKTKFDNGDRRYFLEGCMKHDAGKELDRPRRCQDYVPR